jgi:hypothetical protein
MEFDKSLINKSPRDIAKENRINYIVWNLPKFWDSEVEIDWRIIKNIEEETKNKYDYNIYINDNNENINQRVIFVWMLSHFFLHKDIIDNQWIILDKFEINWYESINIINSLKNIKEESREFVEDYLVPRDSLITAYNKSKDLYYLSNLFEVPVYIITWKINKLWLK